MSPASSGGMRVAFFGGSFDPPHLGHVAVAHAALQALNLDLILFAPVGLQPLKPTGSSASFEDRVAMTRLAIAGEPRFDISLADGPKPDNAAPNFTVDTLTSLRESFPEETQFSLLLGADSFRTLHHWHRSSKLIFLANLIVASRPNEDLGNLTDNLPPGVALHPLSGQPDHYQLTNSAGDQSQLTILPDLHYNISATQLRSQIHGEAAQQPSLLDPAVLEYIHQHHLYE
jgi:nicotinate-nucleotide adenylyltransferase